MQCSFHVGITGMASALENFGKHPGGFGVLYLQKGYTDFALQRLPKCWMLVHDCVFFHPARNKQILFFKCFYSHPSNLFQAVMHCFTVNFGDV